MQHPIVESEWRTQITHSSQSVDHHAEGFYYTYMYVICNENSADHYVLYCTTVHVSYHTVYSIIHYCIIPIIIERYDVYENENEIAIIIERYGVYENENEIAG